MFVGNVQGYLDLVSLLLFLLVPLSSLPGLASYFSISLDRLVIWRAVKTTTPGSLVVRGFGS